MSINSELQSCIEDLVDTQRGILAMDESNATLSKRFANIHVNCNEESRRDYRSALLASEGLGEFISGAIFFEETLTQRNEQGQTLADMTTAQNMVIGIKVDSGTGPLAGSPGDMITYGLDGLEQRLTLYKEQGARFAKWREIYRISHHNPRLLGLSANAETLARYAAVCQQLGIVPIIEAEILMDGKHSSEHCKTVCERVLSSVFQALRLHHVSLEHILLKPSMVTAGKDCTEPSDAEQIASDTLNVLLRTVPAAVPSINFLSGGQSPEQATANLNALNQINTKAPWQLSSSFGRALQQPALRAWKGRSENEPATQQALLKRAYLNTLAQQGRYQASLE